MKHGVNRISYDFEDRLIRRTKPDGTVIDYVYDANGQRVQKSVMQAFQPAIVIGYLIDSQSPSGWPQCVAEVAWTGTDWQLATTYTYGPQGPISQWTSTQGDPGRLAGASRDSFWLAEGRDEREARASQHHFLLDAHGNVRALVDANGQVVSAMDYDAHGVPLSVTPAGSPTSSLGYNGEYFDADLGMIYLRARWYNPSTGRFHTRDPYQGTFEDPMSMQAYLFAHGDPESMIDPSGNDTLVELLTSLSIDLKGYTENYLRGVKTDAAAVREIGTLLIATNLAASIQSVYANADIGNPLDWHAMEASLLIATPHQFLQIRDFRNNVDKAEKQKNLAPLAARTLAIADFTLGAIEEKNAVESAGLHATRKMNGYPELTPFTGSFPGTVWITLTGKHSSDVSRAKALTFYAPKGIDWHHQEVLGIMQGVEKQFHNGFSHWGSKPIYKMVNGNGYTRRKQP
jgi:RHS repeat-associated protein